MPLPPSVALLDGGSPTTTVFPNDRFTVADTDQRTGRRIALPAPSCPAGETACDDVALLNTLDGFDLQPRVSLPFSGPIDLRSVTRDTVFVEGPDASRNGLVQLVVDPATNTVFGVVDDVLREGTLHRLVVTDGVRAADGTPVDPCGGCPARRRITPFTTLSATTQLDGIRRALDDGSAYRAAGIANRGVSFTPGGPGTTRTVFPAPTVTRIERLNQRASDPAAPKVTETVLNTAVTGAGSYAFGSFLSPRYANERGVIAATPTEQVPAPLRSERVGFALVTPLTPPPAGGYPVAIFGPGFTRSKYDLFLAADFNADRDIATIAIDPLGHAFGPESQIRVSQGPIQTTFTGFGRGRNIDGDAFIGNTEGVGPAAQPDGEGPPSRGPDTLVSLRDGLIQTVVDNMALVRAVEAGIDVDGNGTNDLRTSRVSYYGQSFGGIYGTMLVATDPKLSVSVLNVPGGPINDIARLSGFRASVAAALTVNRPALLNGGPGRNGFTESIPGRLDPPVVQPVAGALPIQELLYRGSWLTRSGSPEAYAPLLRRRPRTGNPEERFLYQVAFGDQTVPNPTSGTLVRAGGFADRVSYYRNDKTTTFAIDPHGFLLSPFSQGRNQGQVQMIEFLASGGMTVVDPDTALGATFEFPIANAINLDCLHYADPQTGVAAAGQAFGPDCVDRSGEVPAPGSPTPVVPETPLAVLLPLVALGLVLVATRRRAARWATAR